MAYVCDDCPSQPTGSIITARPLCAELAKCFVPLKRFKMTVKLLRKLITSTSTTWACYSGRISRFCLFAEAKSLPLSSTIYLQNTIILKKTNDKMFNVLHYLTNFE